MREQTTKCLDSQEGQDAIRAMTTAWNAWNFGPLAWQVEVEGDPQLGTM